MKSQSKRYFIILLVLGIIFISTSAIIIKFSNAPSSILGMYRMLFASIGLIPIIYIKRSEFQKTKAKEWLQLLCSSFFLFLHFLFWFESLKLTTVASSTIILALQPLVAMIGGFLLFKEKVSFVSVVAMVVAIFGVGLIGFGDIDVSKEAIIGDLYSFISVIAVVGYLMVGQTIVKKISHWIYSFFVFVFTAVFFFFYNLITKTEMLHYEGKEWGLFILLAIIPTLAHVIHNYLLLHVGATTISMSIVGEPVGASILAYFLLNERFETFQWFGGLLVIVSVWIFLHFQSVVGINQEQSKIVANEGNT